MDKTEKENFFTLINSISELDPRWKAPTPAGLSIWFEALKRFELTQISEALTRHVNDPDAGQFFPKPADVVRNIDGSKSDRASCAWSNVDRAVRQVGCYQSVCFDSAITNRVIADMGGWIELNKANEKEWPFKEQDFKKRYQSFVLNLPREFPKYLVGISEAHNKANNLPIKPPILIGDQKKAEIVYKKGNEMKLEFKPLGDNLLKQISGVIK